MSHPSSTLFPLTDGHDSDLDEDDEEEYQIHLGSSSSSLSPTSPMPPLPPLLTNSYKNDSRHPKSRTPPPSSPRDGLPHEIHRPARIMLTSAMSIDDDDVGDEEVIDVGEEDGGEGEKESRGVERVVWRCGDEDEVIGKGEEEKRSATCASTPSSLASTSATPPSPMSTSVTNEDAENSVGDQNVQRKEEDIKEEMGHGRFDGGSGGTPELGRVSDNGVSRKGAYVGQFVDR